EGPQEKIAGVGFAGNHAIGSADLATASKLKPDTPYTPQVIQTAIGAIKERYANLGYRYADVQESVVRDGANLRVTLTIIEGPTVRAGRVLVRGNFKTSRWVVTDSLALKPGDLYTTDAIEKGRASLRDTGLFTTLRTDVYPPPERAG